MSVNARRALIGVLGTFMQRSLIEPVWRSGHTNEIFVPVVVQGN
jgi:hypothetical protein